MKNDLRKEWLISTLACVGMVIGLDAFFNESYVKTIESKKNINNEFINDVFSIENTYTFIPKVMLEVEDNNIYAIAPAIKNETENGEVLYIPQDGYELEEDHSKKLVLKLK